MRFKKSSILALFSVFAFTISFAVNVQMQEKPLSLAQVLTGLQSQSGGLTMAQKNEFITERVSQRGTTFRLTPQIESELRQAGASLALINAIRQKSPRVTPTPLGNNTVEKPDASFEDIWVEQGITENGEKGMRIYATFSVSNLKDVSSDIVYRFQREGKFIKGGSTGFRTKSGELSTRRLLKPSYTSTVYTELTAFIPYKEFNLTAGTYPMKLDADVIKRDGTLVKHLILKDITVDIPSSNKISGDVEFEKMWVDYDVREGNKLGMRIHVKMRLKGMKDQSVMLAVYFDKQDGTKLTGLTTQYRSKGGQTAVYRRLKPGYDTTIYNDLQVFIPYSEFNLPAGQYNLRMHGDIIYPEGGLIAHLNYYPFRYSKK